MVPRNMTLHNTIQPLLVHIYSNVDRDYNADDKWLKTARQVNSVLE